MRLVAGVLLVAVAAGCASRRDEQMKFLLDELTILREELKQHRGQLEALKQRNEQQDRRLQAKLELLRQQMVRLEGQVARVERQPASSGTTGPVGIGTLPMRSPPRVARIGPDHYRVSRSALMPHELMRSARIVPHISGGRVIGFKLYGIRTGGLMGQLGLKNGDVVRSVNGQPLTSPHQALTIYSQIRTMTKVTLEITRLGRPITLRYTILP